jgi:hypothetical protein
VLYCSGVLPTHLQGASQPIIQGSHVPKEAVGCCIEGPLQSKTRNKQSAAAPPL